jgi:hypothetical protein
VQYSEVLQKDNRLNRLLKMQEEKKVQYVVVECTIKELQIKMAKIELTTSYQKNNASLAKIFKLNV